MESVVCLMVRFKLQLFEVCVGDVSLIILILDKCKDEHISMRIALKETLYKAVEINSRHNVTHEMYNIVVFYPLAKC